MSNRSKHHGTSSKLGSSFRTWNMAQTFYGPRLSRAEMSRIKGKLIVPLFSYKETVRRHKPCKAGTRLHRSLFGLGVFELSCVYYMSRPTVGGDIKQCCSPSVCQSVCLSHALAQYGYGYYRTRNSMLEVEPTHQRGHTATD